MSDQAVLEGAISVEAALESGSRAVEVVYVCRDLRNRASVARLERLAASLKVPVEDVEAHRVEELAQGRTHGGVIALVGQRRFVSLDDLLIEGKCPFVVMLDGIEDPFNFGAAVRALYAAGADGLVLRPRNWMSAASTVARSSAGASELILTAIAETAHDAADFFAERGLAVACATRKGAVSVHKADLTVPLFLVIGGEKRGITRSFLDRASLRISIPYRRDFRRSLGTASAIAVIAFEVMRQRSPSASHR